MATRKARAKELEVPDEIAGRFVVGDEIGRGSFATVYKGSRVGSRSQVVAIKAVVRGKLTSKLLQNLQDEIDILKRIRHGNVVGLVDCISTEHYIYLVMQYCSLGDLSMYIKHRRPSNVNPEAQGAPINNRPAAHDERWPHPADGGLNEWVVRSFLGQLADALRFLRQHDIVHRDIKPQNLLLHPSPPSRPPSPSSQSPLQEDAFGTTPPPGVTYLAGSGSQNPEAKRHVPEGIPILRVADFGFARVLDPAAGLAETLCGSPLYMAPEILRYEKYDAKADLWSVGAVLFEACVGKPPFRAQNHVELLKRIEKGADRIVFPDEKPWPPAPAPGKEPGQSPPAKPHVVPDDVKSLIRALLRQNPTDRISFESFFDRAGSVSNVGPLRRRYEGIRPPSTTSLPTPNNTRFHGLISKAVRPAPPVPAIPAPKPIHSDHDGAFVVSPARPMGPTLTRQSSKTVNPGHNAPSPSALPSPIPRPSFPAKYVVAGGAGGGGSGGGGTGPTSQPIPIEGVKTRDYAVIRPAAPLGKAKAVEMTREPSDDDSVVGREYVVVEKRAVEINALVDDMATSPRKPALSLTRRVSRGFLPRPSPSPHSPSPPTPSSTGATGYPSVSFPPRPHNVPSPPSYFTASPPPHQHHQHQQTTTTGASPRSFDGMRSPRPGFPTSAFAKAITAKAFSPTSNEVARRGGPSMPSPSLGTGDPVESRLVAELEDYAQKVLVILQFADEKLAALLPPTPNHLAQNSPSPHHHPPGRPSPSTGVVGGGGGALGAFAPPVPHQAATMKRTPSSSSSPGGEVSASRIEGLAGEATALYFKALAFLDRAIRHAAEVSAQRRESNPSVVPGPEVSLAMEWLRTKFNEAFSKADFVKSKADFFPDSTAVATKLIYERALEKSRSAAVDELMGENPNGCEVEYETALWMLAAIKDPAMRSDQDRSSSPVLPIGGVGVGVGGGGVGGGVGGGGREGMSPGGGAVGGGGAPGGGVGAAGGDVDQTETLDRFIASIKVRLSALRKKMAAGGTGANASPAAGGTPGIG